MPKFKMLKEGLNEELAQKTLDSIRGYLTEIFEDYELTEVDGIFSFAFGSVSIEIRVLGWHSEDVLVQVYSYIGDELNITPELMERLLRLNASTPFGSFGIGFDSSIVYSYSVAGTNLDMNEFLAAVQTVATIADEYDEEILEQGNIVA